MNSNDRQYTFEPQEVEGNTQHHQLNDRYISLTRTLVPATNNDETPSWKIVAHVNGQQFATIYDDRADEDVVMEMALMEVIRKIVLA